MKDKDKDKKTAAPDQPEPVVPPESAGGAKEAAAPPSPKTVPLDDYEALEKELAELKDKYLRMLAETDNFKKRNAEELRREKQYASMPVCDKMIDAVDTFELALAVKTEDPNFKNFLYGFRMIKDLIYNVLVAEGVTQIPLKEGDTFDPNVAHAIDTSHDPDLPEHVVLKVVKNGYRYKERLLRPAMVTINVKPVKEPETKAPDANAALPDDVA